MTLLSSLSDFLWGGPMLAAFLAVGGWYSLRTGFFQLFHLPLWWKATAGTLFHRQSEGRGITRFQALSASLASIIGTGSVAGVATAVFCGGPGAVFWMWVSALLGMMTGFAEKTLAVRYRSRDSAGQWQGGPMEYMRQGLRLPALAGLFAALAAAEALMGSGLVQANSIAVSLEAAAGAGRLGVGIVLAAVVFMVLAGGIRRLGRLTELLVPLMAALYLAGGITVIAVHAKAVPGALEQIVRYAFSPRAAAGGYAMGTALRYGVARGVFTNEAGLGMSAIVHACADVEEPAEQGLWGIFEVFCTTMVICTVTALVILTSGVYVPEEALRLLESGTVPPHMLGSPLVAAGFSACLGAPGEWIVTVSLILFAFTSLLGAGYCARRGLETLTDSRLILAAGRVLLPVCIVWGATADLTAVWQGVDLLCALLAIPNLLALLLLSPEVLRLWRRWLAGRKNNPERRK